MPKPNVSIAPDEKAGGPPSPGRRLDRAARTGAYYWRRHLQQVARVRDSPPVTAAGQCATFCMGSLTLFNASSNACEFVRDQPVLSTSRFSGHAMVVHFLHGTARGEAGGQLVNLRRGDIGFFDMGEAFHVAVSECASLGLLVPRGMLAGEVHGLVLRESQLPAQMLSRHLQNTLLSLPDPGPAGVDAAVEATLAVLQLCADFAPGVETPPVVAVLRRNILGFIDANLDDVELTPELVCRTFEISRTWLYQIFAPDGGVKRWIRERRLDAAFRDLCNNPEQRIIDVVFRCAFSSERQFQRAFLARFGVSPSAVRNARRRGLPLDLPRAHASVAEAVRD